LADVARSECINVLFYLVEQTWGHGVRCRDMSIQLHTVAVSGTRGITSDA